MIEIPKEELDIGSGIPLHVQLDRILRKWLTQKKDMIGKTLPPETLLAKHFGVSRGTLRVSIDGLVRDGLLERTRGRGTRVAAVSVIRSTRLDAWLSFTREMQQQGLVVEDFFCEYRQEPVTEAVADFFDIAAGTPVYVLERVKGFNGHPVVHFMTCFHPRLPLTGNEDFTSPMYDVLEKRCGMRPSRSIDILDAVLPTPALADKLQLVKTIPLLRRERRVVNQAEKPIEFSVNHYRSDTFHYIVELERCDELQEERKWTSSPKAKIGSMPDTMS